MRPVSRPAHYRLSPDEQAQNDAEHQRGQANGFLIALCLALSPAAVPLADAILSAIGVL